MLMYEYSGISGFFENLAVNYFTLIWPFSADKVSNDMQISELYQKCFKEVYNGAHPINDLYSQGMGMGEEKEEKLVCYNDIIIRYVPRFVNLIRYLASSYIQSITTYLFSLYTEGHFSQSSQMKNVFGDIESFFHGFSRSHG